MKKCPECGKTEFSVTFKHVEVFNRIEEVDGKYCVSDVDEDSFEASEKVIECRNCGWEAPTTEEDEFLRWLNGEEFNEIFDHMEYEGCEDVN